MEIDKKMKDGIGRGVGYLGWRIKGRRENGKGGKREQNDGQKKIYNERIVKRKKRRWIRDLG